ncbi:MAG: hypothetical protein LUG95_02450 [Clostridiales bacterium]|nr:hypothetical protein [Clostridiales bacterium]
MKKIILSLCTFVILAFSLTFAVNAQEAEIESQALPVSVSSVSLSKTQYVYKQGENSKGYSR